MSVDPLSLRHKSLSLFTKTAWAILLSCSVAVAGDSLYRLNSGSSFQQGCFAPCECPILLSVPVSGTFLLTPAGSTNQFSTYSVTDINWRFSLNGSTTVVTGSGTYKVSASQQQLTAYLQMNGGKTNHFDSGLVTNSAVFPNIKVSISTNGQYCFDTVFNIDASPIPVPKLHVERGDSNEIVLSWAVSSNTFVLQENTDLTTAIWTIVTNTPTVADQQNQVVLARSSACKFYRLRPGGN
jgi:hypothetical protein